MWCVADTCYKDVGYQHERKRACYFSASRQGGWDMVTAAATIIVLYFLWAVFNTVAEATDSGDPMGGPGCGCLAVIGVAILGYLFFG